jgi:hypothetical protein
MSIASKAIAVALTTILLACCCSGGGGGGGDGFDGTFDDDEYAYADMYNAIGHQGLVPVRGRLVVEDESVDITDTRPLDQISQDEIKDTMVSVAIVSGGDRYELGEVSTDGEGYLDASFTTDAPTGSYTIEVFYDGDLVGTASLILLDDGHSDVVVRSDVDLTYLNTDFMSSSGLLGLMTEKADDRATLPGMEEVYNGLREADGAGDRSVVFLSGSPRFFKRIIEGKMQLDGVDQDGLVLKPFKDIVVDNIRDFDVDQIVDELHEQIGYKLYWLLRLRLEVPSGTREILMGDDSEADVVVYNLYHRFTAGELDPSELDAELVLVGVTDSWRGLIDGIASDVQAAVAGAPVAAIYINATGAAGDTFPVSDWVIDDLIRYHEGTWPLVLDMYEEGWVSEGAAQDTRDRLVTLGATDESLAAAASNADFLDPGSADAFQ